LRESYWSIRRISPKYISTVLIMPIAIVSTIAKTWRCPC
jgi:hypothetical protein